MGVIGNPRSNYKMSRNSNRCPLRIVIVAALAVAVQCAIAVWLAPTSLAQEAQEKAPAQTAGVDRTKMGAYRALAQLSFRAFQKGNHPEAAQLAMILERVWDAAEGGGGERSLVKRNQNAFGRIDQAMDNFVKPILDYERKVPDPVAVQAAYGVYLDALKEGDR
jgi:hypothetical protein